MRPIHISSGQGTEVNLIGIPATIRLRGRDTGGTISLIEMRDQPGGGAPLHIHHREDETFHVLEGEYDFTCCNKTFVANPGDTVFGPRGVPHGYHYLGATPGRILLLATPAGIEEWFEEVGAMDQPEILEVIELGKNVGSNSCRLRSHELAFLRPPGCPGCRRQVQAAWSHCCASPKWSCSK